ncbi:thioredoxin family protein [Candidatus Poribacteria bacterium]|nr:thioredoxin family protein [Candidatus Poribacteria bacterium]
MEPTVDAVASEHRDTLIIGTLDIDKNPQTVSEYSLRATPTYIIFRDGEVVGEFTGAMPKATFVERIFDILE